MGPMCWGMGLDLLILWLAVHCCPTQVCPFKGLSGTAHLQALIQGAPAGTLNKERGQASCFTVQHSFKNPHSGMIQQS